MYKVRYSRLWSFGNYENEKVELEQEFSEAVSFSEALSLLSDKVWKDHEKREQMREVGRHVDVLKEQIRIYRDGLVYEGASENQEENKKVVAGLEKDLTKANRLFRKLSKELLGE